MIFSNQYHFFSIVSVAPQRAWPLNLVPGLPTSADLPSPADQQQDVLETLEAIERETFLQITEHELTRDNRQYTPHKCCKIGKKVADKGLYCTIDLMQVIGKNFCHFFKVEGALCLTASLY